MPSLAFPLPPSRFLFGLALCLSFASHANEGILVQVPAVLDSGAPIAESVKRECGVESLVGNHVFQKVSESFGGTGLLPEGENTGPGKVLQLTILSVQGMGGGSWSGSKAVTIRAQLSENGKAVGATVLRRRSRGGMLGGLSGTCPIIERIAIALGQDVAKWLPHALRASQSGTVLLSDLPPAKELDEDIRADEPGR